MQPVCYFVQDSTPTAPPPPPHPGPNSFASADDITKESLAPYDAGSGGVRVGGLIWIKLDRGVDTALKVSRPFMSRWQGV